MPKPSAPDATPDNALASFIGRYKVPGAAVGVVHGDEEYVAAQGVLKYGEDAQVTPDSLFRIGSVTKTVTATIVAALAEERVLDLEEHVAAYMPELRLSTAEAARQLRVWHLLSHVAGWQGDHWTDTGSGDDALKRVATDVLPLLPQVTPVGTLASYNNVAVMLAGRVIEQVCRAPYAAVATDRVLRPLGMNDTYFSSDEIERRPHAGGHHYENGVPVADDVGALPRAFEPTGGLASSVRDQMRYLRFHLDGSAPGRTPLSLTALADMRRPRASMGGGVQIGLGWFLRHRDGRLLVSHSGNVSGRYLTTMLLVPEERLGLVVLTNASGGKPLGERMVEWALRERLGMSPRTPPPPVPAPLGQYTGRYRAGAWSFDVSQDRGSLVAHLSFDDDPQGDPPVRLRLIAPDVVAAEDNPGESVGDFIRNPDGSIGWFRWALRLASKEEA